MKPKEFKIETITDIVNATNPNNLENFITDLRLIVQSLHLVKSCVPEEERSEISYGAMEWVDDGEHNITVDVNGKEFIEIAKKP